MIRRETPLDLKDELFPSWRPGAHPCLPSSSHSWQCNQATCTVPTTTGYSVGSASGAVTMASFAPGGVTCAAGYTGTVSYTVCGSAGTAYSVSGCQASCMHVCTCVFCFTGKSMSKRHIEQERQ